MESDTIEYKAELSLDDDTSRRKFLAGIAAFANGSGGNVVYGIQAKNDRPLHVRPLSNFDSDQTLLRIPDLIRTGIEPPVLGCELQPVALAGGGHALVIGVRKTWAGAHMVTYNGDNRFYIRHGGGRRLLDVEEIRSAFVFPETIRDKIERFRLNRLGDILTDESVCKLGQKAALVVHMIRSARLTQTSVLTSVQLSACKPNCAPSMPGAGALITILMEYLFPMGIFPIIASGLNSFGSGVVAPLPEVSSGVEYLPQQ